MCSPILYVHNKEFYICWSVYNVKWSNYVKWLIIKKAPSQEDLFRLIMKNVALIHFILYRYISAAKTGEEIIINAETLRVGRNLAFLNVDVINKESGALIAKGSHTKYVG